MCCELCKPAAYKHKQVAGKIKEYSVLASSTGQYDIPSSLERRHAATIASASINIELDLHKHNNASTDGCAKEAEHCDHNLELFCSKQ